MRGEGRRRREGRGGLSGNVAEETFCLKSAPDSYSKLAVSPCVTGISTRMKDD